MSNKPQPPSSLPEEENTQPVRPENRTTFMSPVRDQPPPEYTPYGPRKHKPPKEASGLYLPLWSVALMLIVVLALAGGIIALVIVLGGPSTVTGGNPQVIIITAAVTPTPVLPGLSQSTPQTPLVGPTLPAVATIALEGPTLVPTETPTPTPLTISVGGRVQVVGASGVNVRLSPGMDQGVAFVGNPGDIYTVLDGPQQLDVLTWWQVRDSSGRSGWAAESDGTQQLLEAVP